MKSALFAIFLFATASTLLAQAPAPAPANAVPEALQPQVKILKKTYAKVEAKRFPKAPADTVWMFRSPQAAAGTVEVGFQGTEVVYMIFRRGLGGASWKLPEIHALHVLYHQDLLQETYTPYNHFSKYQHALAPQINGAVITRKDFDARAVMSGN